MGNLKILKVATITVVGIWLSGLVSRSAKAAEQKDAISRYLSTVGTNDVDLFSQNNLDRVSESHADDVVVTWPDGHQTKGLEKHLEDLKAIFVYAPDIKITKPPIKFGSGEWTCVKATMTGTFSRPMIMPRGRIIHPTGKSFNVPIVIVGQWRGGKMVAEWFSWDNQTFMRQIGLPSSTSAYPSPQ